MPGNPRPASVHDLQSRFAGLMRRLGLEPHAEAVYRILAGDYSESGRHYHTLEHVQLCLARVDEVRERLDDADGAELALWFHDAVHDPAADDNELRSAFLFDRLAGIHIPTDRADRIHAMIMATRHAGDTAGDGDAAYVADIDLSGFAAPWPEVQRRTRLLRQECGHLNDADFEQESRKFFDKLLARPSIYLSDHFRETCEQQARRNIEKLMHKGLFVGCETRPAGPGHFP